MTRLLASRGASHRRPGRRRTVLAPLAIVLLMLGLLPAAPAAAAGPAVVSVSVTITDPATGLPMTSVNSQTQPLYLVNVAYSCNVEDCTGVTVSIPPSELDPFYGTQRRDANSYIFNPPYTPAPPISGTAYTGLTVSLGTVTAGTSGSFSIQYSTGGRPFNQPASGSFFLNGSSVERQATITATNSDNPATDTSDPVPWVSAVADPVTELTAPASTRTDTNITVGFASSHSGCVRWDSSFANFRGQPWLTCAASYVGTVQLPPNADYVPGSGGTYDAGSHTVTFANTGFEAARGLWQEPNTFQVTFPSSSYPTTGADCVVAETFTATQTVTYLEGTVKTGTATPRMVQAQNCAPFAKANIGKTMQTGGPPGTDFATATLAIPNAPAPPNTSPYWRVTVGNQANVPGVATITDNTLDQPDLPVTSVDVAAGGPATITYTLDDNTSGTVTGMSFDAPAGRRIVAVSATSSLLIGPNPVSTGTAVTPFTLAFHTSIASGATPGTRTNTASGTVAYPDHPALGTVAVGPFDRTITLQPTPIAPLTFTANVVNAVVQGGGTAVAGSDVEWRFRETIANVPAGTQVVPQLVFLAPKGWNMTADSHRFDVGAPADVAVEYKTVTYNGDVYNAVVATWPGPLTVVSGGTVTLPSMYVMTVPTIAAPAGTNTGIAFTGDLNQNAGTYSTPYVDATDFDDDGATTDTFSRHTRNIALAGTRSVGVTKEICRPNPSAADGCDWISNSSVLVGVPPSATAIKYRVTIRNTGNDALSNVAAYDVLPFVGDTGTTTATAGTPRGSTVQEVVASVSNISSGVALTYSTSTNPPRPEVYSGATTGTWTTTVVGASAIKAIVASLPAFQTRSFIYEASLVGGAADQIACNSVAVNAATLVAIEPAAVCATTQEADFSVVAGDRFPLQVGRPGMVPFVINNGGGSLNASGTVTLSVPTGLTIADLTVSGWSCTAPSMIGSVTVTCQPVNPDGSSRSLAMNVPETIPLKVIPGAGTDGGQLCVAGSVVGLIYDPELDNNGASVCSTVVAAAPTGLSVNKDDGLTLVAPGGQHTYTVQVDNRLVAERVTGAVLTDTLPANVRFVSSTPPGVVSGQNADGTGGSITWNLADLSPVGLSNADGDGLTGGAAPSQTITVTVEATASATDTVANTAAVTAPDPAGGAPLGDDDDDIDTLQRAAITLTKTADPPVVTTVGQQVTYTLQITNGSNVPLTGVQIIDPMVGLSPITCSSGPLPLTLAAGVADTCTATYNATGADFLAGQFVNNATASGQPTLGPPISTTASATVYATQMPGLTMTKHATELDFDAAGDVLHFTFDVENTGNVPLTGLTVNDQLAGTAPVSCLATTLAPGATTTCSTTYTATAANVDAGGVTNTATATASAPGGPVTTAPSTVEVDAAQTAALTVVKTAAETSFAAAGTTIHYQFLVTNIGNTTLTNVTINDDSLTGLSAISCPSTTLLAGAVQTCTATYTTTQDDVDEGGVVNTASGSADSPLGPIDSPPSAINVPALQQPAISLVKTVDLMQLAVAGQTATYSFLVTNTGNVTLTNVGVTDDFPVVGLSEIDCSDVSVLAPGASMTCTATYDITQDDIDESNQLINRATASGTPPTGPVVESNESSAPIPPVVAPGLTVVKSATETSFAANGVTLHFAFAVTNSGNMTLKNLLINDPLPGVSAVSCPPAPLAPGGTVQCTATYVTTQADVDNGGVTNTATASATTGGGQTVTSPASQVTVPAARTRNVTFVKDSTSPDDTYNVAGQPVTFTFSVTNTGNTTISGITVTDTMPGVSNVGCPATILAPLASTTCTATYTVTQQDLDEGSIVNDAMLDATSPAGPIDDEPATYTMNAATNAGISLTKSAQELNFDAAGDALHYRFTVTNTGNVTVSNVQVADPLPGIALSMICPADRSLEPGASLTCDAVYTVTQADVDNGGVTNTATATADDPATTPVEPDTATLIVPAVRMIDATLVKDTLTGQTTYDATGPITFTFVVTNTGNVTLGAIDLTENLANVSDPVCPDAPASLGPSETMSCTATYTVTQQDIDDGSITNSATVTATPANGSPMQWSSNDVTLTAVQDPALTLSKVATEDDFDGAGQTLHYTFTVTNSGNVTVDGVAIVDPLPGIVLGTCDATTLAPTQVATCTATYVTTQTDVDDGGVTNTATATATDSDETAVTSNESTAEVESRRAASATFTKGSSDSTYSGAGQEVTYTFLVDNTGNVTLSDIAIADHLAGVSVVVCPATTLAPDDGPMTCTATYTVTQGDLDTGSIVNTATLTAIAPPEQTVQLDSGLVLTGTQSAAIAIIKSAQEASFDTPGDTLHYTFHVTNTGNVVLSDVTVTDPLPGLSAIACPDTELVPGAAMDCTATYATTQDDVDAGGVSNTATATGVPPSHELEGPVALALVVASAESSTFVPAVQNSAVTLTKTADVPSYAAGQTITYSFLVTNTGNVTVNGLTVNDPLPGLSAVTCPVATLAPSASTTCTATYVATQSDVVAGAINNTATVSAAGGASVPLVSQPSTVQVAAVVTPPPPPPTTPVPSTPADPGELPATGGNTQQPLLYATVLVVAGLLALGCTRRRRRA